MRTLIIGLMVCLAAGGQETDTYVVEADADSIRSYGLMARLDPERRDEMLVAVARTMETLGRTDSDRLHDLQGHFQYALLLACDPDVRGTLRRDTVETIDNALESIFTLEDINRDNRWEPLIYVYGFFNHDVTPANISAVIEPWRRLTPAERGPRYPTYVHTIDAVTKPLAYGGLGSHEETARALDLAVPMLKDMLTQAPAPGTAFHPASHACLVLGPLYERWANDAIHGQQVRAVLGDEAAFVDLMAGQLAGSQPNADAFTAMEAGFYAYTGRYLANALARMNARNAAPALRRSLALYQQYGAREPTISYTRRALIALGDETLRDAIEGRLADPATEDLAVWLCRNGQAETRRYGESLLGRILECPPSAAHDTYFKAELARTRG